MSRPTIYFLILFFATITHLQAQQVNKRIFTVVSISENAGNKLKQLNDSLAAAKTTQNVRDIIRGQRLKNTIIKLYISTPGAPKRYWKIDTKYDTESGDDFRVLRSKGTERAEITRLNDFRELLPDTLLLLDTILFNIRLAEPGYKDSWFTVHRLCNDKEESLPATKNKDKQLVLSPTIANCDPYTTITICNDYNPKRQLRNFVVTRLHDYDHKILEGIAKDFLHDNPTTTTESFSDFMNAVMTTYYGHPMRDALTNWIRLHVSTALK